MRTTIMNTDRRDGRSPGRATAAVVMAAALLAGCEVTNPGPIQDEFLTVDEAHEGFVNGSQRKMAEALGWIAYTGGIVSREIFPGGQTGAYGHDVLVQGGYITPGTFGGHWGDAQQARFIAEEALRRFEGLEVDPEIIAQAHVWAGYAHRVLGENWCEAVLDGGPIEPGRRYFEEAEEHFTHAISSSNATLSMAARAGRAQVRVWLDDWAGAESDAAGVPDDFEYFVDFDNTEADTRNTIQWANATTPYRSYSTWNTFQEDYYAASGDPRAAEYSDPKVEFAAGALSGYGQVPWRNQRKFTSPDDDGRLAGGREMRLIQAEALLERGEHVAAMTIINDMRATITSDLTGEPLEPWAAGSLEEAWTILKRERAIELWLEARRWGDQRRWEDNNTPGDIELPNFEAISPLFSENPRSRCLDIPDSERESNPNVPTVG